MDQTTGFLNALFDTRFQTLITPRVIRVLYILIMIAIGLGAIAFVVAAFASSVGFGIVTLLVLAPLGALLYLIVARIYLELVIVFFKIKESTDQIAATKGPAV